jgi:inorganic pyrophosphatase
LPFDNFCVGVGTLDAGAALKPPTRGARMHPWHDIPVPLDAITERLPVLIEIPAGTKNKYELDKQTGLLKLDRVLHSAVRYPTNYGFIPRSYCDDGDPLDVLVLGQDAVLPMTIVHVRPIGVMHMRDQGKADDKVLAAATYDPAFAHVKDLGDVPTNQLLEIRRFFIDYKVLEEKTVEVEPFDGRERAIEVIMQALKDYEAAREALMQDVVRG